LSPRETHHSSSPPFVIAHRLATLRNATRTGAFDGLAQRGGFFAELVQAQFAPAK
jgi:ABC-type multidrug transport system fused ATPase/permease subunit